MFYLVILVLISVSDCYKILVLLPYPGKSHHMVFEPILDELTRRGNLLTVVSFFPSTTPNIYRRDVSLVGLAPLNVEVVDLKNYDYTPVFGQMFINFFNQFAIVQNLTRESIKLCDKILHSDVFKEFVQAKGDYDVILVEHFNSDCMFGIVHNYALPSIGLMSCSLMPWTTAWVGGDDNPATFPSMLMPFTDEMTFFDKLVNSFDLFFHKTWHKYVSISEQVLVEKRLGRKLPPLEEIGRNASVVLVNTYHSLNGVRVSPPSLIEIGGVHLHNRSVKPLPKELEEWIQQSKHGILLVSFGSLIRSSTLPPKRLTAILKVFARLPQRVVWKWENENMQDLPENVRIMKWLPQYDILHHPECLAFMSHGGLLSLTEAVGAGVPSLVVPVLGDQLGNAAHARRARVAHVLPFNAITEENLYDALMKVLSSEMRDQAKAFSKLWWDRPLPPMDTAIYYIEKTARYGNLNMSSQARLLHNHHLVFFSSLPYIVIICTFFITFSCCCSKKTKVKQS